jgi:hypothetical protein
MVEQVLVRKGVERCHLLLLSPYPATDYSLCTAQNHLTFICAQIVVHLAPSAALHGSILGELLRRGLSPITPLDRKLL